MAAQERIAEPVPTEGWWVVARTKGPLNDLHRLDPQLPRGTFAAGTRATVCQTLVRTVYEVPVGTPAHLCKDCS